MTSNASVTGMENLSGEQRMWRWRVLTSTYIAYSGYYLCRKVFSICKTTLMKEFDFGPDLAAHLWATYLIAYMLGQFASSFLGRRWGPRVLLLGGLGVSMAVNVVFGTANSYQTFLGFMFVNGIAQGSGWGGCVGSIAPWLRKEERGRVMGLWNTNFVTANIVVKSAAGFLLANFGWRNAFFGCTSLTLLTWFLVVFWQRNRPEDVGLPSIVGKAKDEGRMVRASDESRVSFREYLQLLLNPWIPAMGLGYFCLKSLRYALDSWLPAFLNMQGLDVGRAAYFSLIFDLGGFAGVVACGWMFDRVFKGRWPGLCLTLGIGMTLGYACAVQLGGNPIALALIYGVIGFMMCGPDSILCGVASIQVAGDRNAVAVAAMVNGIGSFGPVLHEEVIGQILKGRTPAEGIHATNMLAFGISLAFVALMAVVSLRVRGAKANPQAS